MQQRPVKILIIKDYVQEQEMCAVLRNLVANDGASSSWLLGTGILRPIKNITLERGPYA